MIVDEANTKKNINSNISLPCSRHRPQTPIDKGMRAREGYPFSLPSPSRFYLRTLPSFLGQIVNPYRNKIIFSFFEGEQWDPKREGNGREINSPSRASNALYIRL